MGPENSKRGDRRRDKKKYPDLFRDFAETHKRTHKTIATGANTKEYKREGKVTLLESI